MIFCARSSSAQGENGRKTRILGIEKMWFAQSTPFYTVIAACFDCTVAPPAGGVD